MPHIEKLDAYFHRHDGEILVPCYKWCPAKPAKDFRAGDIMICTGGATQEVVEVTPCGKTMVHLFVRCMDGRTYDKRCKADTLYAYHEGSPQR